MLFNSLEFLIFFPLVTILYFLIPHKYRWALLLASSCIFYMAFIPKFILILSLTITVDYISGVYIEKVEKKYRKRILIISLVTNLGILFFFKYFNFFVVNINNIAAILNWNYSIELLKIILPIGLSFHTFQSMSYVIEVYRGNQKAERNYGIFALYVMFYPQLVAGPIERPQNMLHQFYEKHDFDYYRITTGLKLMAWGMFKKVVIADRVAVYVNSVYNNIYDYSGITLVIATVFFAIQIYCDFSGYSEIAIGAAEVMGFKLMKNFDRPYYSKSISEFWRRWHISLSTWFKDYVYIPLGGNRVPKLRLYFNLFITFTLSGLWHGANWTYVAWGAINGIYLIFSIITQEMRCKVVKALSINRIPQIHKIFKVIITFSLICFSWIFFRSNTIQDAFYVINNIFKGDINVSTIVIGGKIDFLIAIVSILIMESVQLLQRKLHIRQEVSKLPIYMRWALYYTLILWILLFGVFGNNEFIYFQF